MLSGRITLPRRAAWLALSTRCHITDTAMSHSPRKHTKALDLRSPLVFDVRDLGPGAARTLTRRAPAPKDMGVELARIPAGADLDLGVQLEGVTEGVLVTATVAAPMAGECARCLDSFTSATTVRFQELFVLPADAEQEDEADGYVLDGNGMLDLEPALRDAMVLDLPLSPLCELDCRGLCPECGVRLADAEPGHGHEQRGAMWDALKDFRADSPGGDPSEEDARPDGTSGPDSETDRTHTAPEQAKER
jgi:uncharacterized protein